LLSTRFPYTTLFRSLQRDGYPRKTPRSRYQTPRTFLVLAPAPGPRLRIRREWTQRRPQRKQSAGHPDPAASQLAIILGYRGRSFLKSVPSPGRPPTWASLSYSTMRWLWRKVAYPNRVQQLVGHPGCPAPTVLISGPGRVRR